MSKISVNEEYGRDYIRKRIVLIISVIYLESHPFIKVLQQNETDFLILSMDRLLHECQNGKKNLYIPSYADVLKSCTHFLFWKRYRWNLVHLLSGRTGEKKGTYQKYPETFSGKEAF